MELKAILLARVSALLEIETLDPRGSTLASEAIKNFAEKYSFMKTPQKIEELDFQKGIELSSGKMGEVNIDRLTFFGNGIVVDTRSLLSGR